MSPTDIAALFGVGLAAGLVGGMLGIGGALVMIPGLIFLRGNADGPAALHLYKLAAIAASIVVAIPAAIRHGRAGAVQRSAWTTILPFALLAIPLGVWVAGLFAADRSHALEKILGGVILFAIVAQLFQVRAAIVAVSGEAPDKTDTRAPVEEGATHPLLQGLVVGAPVGFLAGLLGIGGGVWNVPAQHFGFRVPLRTAIANSAVVIGFVAPATTLLQTIAVARMSGLSPQVGFVLALAMAPGALLGGWIGAGLTHRVPTVWLRWCFLIALSAAAIRLIFR